jgi:hypothetical protein
MKSKFALMAIALAGLSMSAHSNGRFYEPDNEPVKAPIPNGAREYEFYGVKVIAIDEKRARAKAAKKAGVKGFK